MPGWCTQLTLLLWEVVVLGCFCAAASVVICLHALATTMLVIMQQITHIFMHVSSSQTFKEE
jgi:hypothetical protein